MSQVPPPLFTLRGHQSAVTALVAYKLDERPYLISGDQVGHIKVWDLNTYREHFRLQRPFKSRIQSLKHAGSLLMIQTRDEGVKLSNIEAFIASKDLIVTHSYPSHEALFSRADMVEYDQVRSVLAHPSSIENHMVSVRMLDSSGNTEISGTAQRISEGEARNSSVFDILILKYKNGDCSLFVAYEDGCLGVFAINPDSAVEVPELRAVGMKIDLARVFNFSVNDFLSAFDVIATPTSDCKIVCGSPLKELIVLTESLGEPKKVPLERAGVSRIRIRPDSKLFVASCWDNSVRLYSMKSCKPLAILRNHLKQVEDILFVKSSVSSSKKSEGEFLLCLASQDCTISISSLY